MVLSSWHKAIARVYPVDLFDECKWSPDRCQRADQANQLGQLVAYYNPLLLILIAEYSFYLFPWSVEGWASLGIAVRVQKHVPKTAYRSICHCECHGRHDDMILDSLTPQVCCIGTCRWTNWCVQLASGCCQTVQRPGNWTCYCWVVDSVP